VPSLKHKLLPLKKSSVLCRYCACGEAGPSTWTERLFLCNGLQVQGLLANALPSPFLAMSNVRVLAFHVAMAVWQQPQAAKTLAAVSANSMMPNMTGGPPFPFCNAQDRLGLSRKPPVAVVTTS